VTTYGYDNASQLTALTYSLGTNFLGNLAYAYDQNGRRTSVGGSFARTGIPNAVSTTAYNANNQLTTWGTANLFYDANGNMTSDGTHSYTWDARNRLAKIDNGTSVSFTYDPFGRRATKNVLGTSTKHAHRVKPENVRAIASEPTGTVPQFLRSAKDRFARLIKFRGSDGSNRQDRKSHRYS
jgi:YD repeat-containing protein